MAAFEDVQDMKKGYVNEFNLNQKGFNIVLNSVYKKLTNNEKRK